jgi:hypothetical protein
MCTWRHDILHKDTQSNDTKSKIKKVLSITLMPSVEFKHILLNVIMLSVVGLNVIMLNVIMLSVVRLNVVAPHKNVNVSAET